MKPAKRVVPPPPKLSKVRDFDWVLDGRNPVSAIPEKNVQ